MGFLAGEATQGELQGELQAEHRYSVKVTSSGDTLQSINFPGNTLWFEKWCNWELLFFVTVYIAVEDEIEPCVLDNSVVLFRREFVRIR